MIEKIMQRITMLVGRGKVLLGSDAGVVQRLQVQLSAQDIKDNTARLGEYGLSSLPPAGSDAVVLFLGGNRSNGVIIATGNQTYRLKNLKPGEVALYDNLGQSVYLTQAGIVVDGASLPITINGNVTINGNLTTTGDVVANGKSLDSHDHMVIALGSPTSPPL